VRSGGGRGGSGVRGGESRGFYISLIVEHKDNEKTNSRKFLKDFLASEIFKELCNLHIPLTPATTNNNPVNPKGDCYYLPW